jgi:UDP-MurNAc hydroxylase
MIITFLGHAGFCVETEHAIVIADPWLSPTGAFDSSWFQLPANHHLAPLVEEKLATPGKKKFVYVSHEHQDHYDPKFLRSLQNRDFTLVIPKYRRPQLRRELSDYVCADRTAVGEGETVQFDGGELKLFLDDSELNRDSALLVRADGQAFLNLNDCRIFDRLRAIREQEGPIDVFTCQFSSSAWHPICYEYTSDVFNAIGRKKADNKLEMTRRAVEQLAPRFLIPSAGPACFLAPELFHLNFDKSVMFARFPELQAYIEPTCRETGTAPIDVMPGDVLDVATGQVTRYPGQRFEHDRFEEYVRSYAQQYSEYFADRDREHALVDAKRTLERLKEELEQKLLLLPLRKRVTIPLYYGLEEIPGNWLRVDFQNGAVDHASEIGEEQFYRVVARAWQIADILDGNLTWETFSLSFRVRLHRVPDSYNQLIHAFLTMDKGDLYRFCRMVMELEGRKERIQVTADGKTYSVNRYCPHNGGDLAEGRIEDGRYLVCARHRWCFDLENGGVCTTNDSTIAAEETSAEEPAAETETLAG